MDKKITALNQTSSVADTDLTVVVTDPATTPETKKIEIGDLKTSLGVPAKGTTVVTQTAYGQSSAVGSNNAYAPSDHAHGTVGHDAHGNLTGVTANQHHAQSHVLALTSGLGADHTVSGLTAGQVLRATGATTAAFQSIGATDLPNTAVTPSSYGDATHVGAFTVDQQGRITAASDVAITAGHTIQDEGTPLPAEPNLDFAGAGVTVTDVPGSSKTLVTIPGSTLTPPAGNDTEVQINNGGAFGSEEYFKYTIADSTLFVRKIKGDSTLGLTIRSNLPTIEGETGNVLNLLGGNAVDGAGITPGQGGLINIQPGIGANGGANGTLVLTFPDLAGAGQVELQGDLLTTYRAVKFPDKAGTLAMLSDIASPVLSGSGAPAPGSGAAGSIYFDIANPNEPLFYFKT